MPRIQIDNETLAELDLLQLSVDGDEARVVITRQLDRPLYAKVNKVLEAAGAKWNRKLKAHLMPANAAAILEGIVLTGEYRNEQQDFGVFYTPAALAARAADALKIRPGMSVLEPEAGMGALAEAARARTAQVTCFDVLGRHVEALLKAGFDATMIDFMQAAPGSWPKFDRVLMNPPFAKQADAQHVLHALKFLKPGGRLVAIMSAAVTFRDTDWYRQVRELATSIEPLPPGSFKESGTSVNAVLVTIDWTGR